MTEEKRKKIFEDAEVAKALFTLATEGYSYTEESTVVTEDGKIEVVTLSKHVPPSVEAQAFWLCNRQPEKWKVDDATMAEIFERVQDQIDNYRQNKPTE